MNYSKHRAYVKIGGSQEQLKCKELFSAAGFTLSEKRVAAAAFKRSFSSTSLGSGESSSKAARSSSASSALGTCSKGAQGLWDQVSPQKPKTEIDQGENLFEDESKHASVDKDAYGGAVAAEGAVKQEVLEPTALGSTSADDGFDRLKQELMVADAALKALSDEGAAVAEATFAPAVA